MSTTKARPKTRYVATLTGEDGKPVDCGFVDPLSLGLANRLQSGHVLKTSLCGQRGILLPKPTDPHVFSGEKSMDIYIRISKRITETFKGTMADEMPALKPLFHGAAWGSRTFVQ